MIPNQPLRLRLAVFTPQLLLVAAPALAQAPQQPTQPQQQESVEQRLERLERFLRQDRLGVQAADASFSTAWIPADTAGVPDFQDTPRAPGVASTVDLKLWGRANFAASYDNFQGIGGVGGIDFINYVTREGGDQVTFNPRDTRFGFAASNAWDNWTGRAVAEIDFYGNAAGFNLDPRLRLGYVEFAHADGFSLRAGQDWNPIGQQNPSTIDFGILALGGNIFAPFIPQITTRYKTGNSEFLLGALHFRVSGSQDQQERMPWIVGRYAWNGFADGKGLLAIGGGYRHNNVRNATATISNDVDNWLVVGEFRMPLGSMLTVNGEAWVGQGIGREFLRLNLDYNANGEAVSAAGGFVSLAIKATEQMTFNVGVGVDQPDDDDTTVTTLYSAATPYDSNRVAFANVRYQFSKQTGMGIELVDFETATVDGGGGSSTLNGQRVTFGTWFIF